MKKILLIAAALTIATAAYADCVYRTCSCYRVGNETYCTCPKCED